MPGRDRVETRGAVAESRARRQWTLPHARHPARYHVKLMPRRLLAILAAVSLALAAVVLFSWWRSYFPSDTSLHTHNGRLVVVFTEGQTTWYFNEQYAGGLRTKDSRGVDWLWTLLRRGSKASPYVAGAPRVREWLGFEVYDNVRPSGRPDYWVLAVPFAYVLGATTLAPAAWLASLAFRRRAARGHCARCGYDLRASSGRCPECGTAAPVPSAV